MGFEEEGVERDVERVLGALGGIETPLGLEGRVLARLAEGRGRRRVAWLPGLVVAGICLGVVWISGGHRGQVRRVEHDAPRRGAELAASQVVQADGARLQGGGERGLVLKATRGVAGVREEAAKGAPARHLSAEEALAEEEMRAPSMPEVPVPMTAQERMLVQVAQGRGSVVWAKTEGAEDAAELKEDGGAEVKVPVRDVASLLEAGLFAGMKASDE